MYRSGLTRINESGLRIPKIDWKKVIKVVARVLYKRRLEPINIVFVTTRRSRELNRKYRRKDRPANVLSFTDSREVVLAPAVIRKEARKYGFSFKEWTLRLVIHGILHLEGYGHNSKSEARKMEQLEKKILKNILNSRLLRY